MKTIYERKSHRKTVKFFMATSFLKCNSCMDITYSKKSSILEWEDA